MKSQDCTDLKPKQANGSLLIIQPLVLATTPGITCAADFLARKEQVFQESLALQFVHRSNLRFSSDEAGTPLIITDHSCGGVLQFRENKNGFVIPHLNGFDTVITCDDPQCALAVGLNLSLSEISHSIFQLLLKQILPELPIANYLDCTRVNFYQRLSSVAISEIREFGLVSLITGFAHSATIAEQTRQRISLKRDLGLTLGNGLLTLDSLVEYDEWLRYLIIKEWEREKRSLPK